ncbi:helix-turn-helix domain-containing protein [Niveispirillum irakense]|uniref:helix-turn-helix domain-containing protein n=1 Tax=Niveispirillum irakense TaxID=34011 RepID=UPI000418BFCD|nr:AraC family transcriptional regulator [Niveispirillum irakense]
MLAPSPMIAACLARELVPVDDILARAIAAPLASDGNGGALTSFQLRRVVLFIEQNLDADLSLNRLAAVTSLSPSHFARRFKGATAMAPHQYVLARRINGAKQLLLETEMKLAEIAIATGFSSQAHLTGMFGRTVGMTPGAYRTRRDACHAFLAAQGGEKQMVTAA